MTVSARATGAPPGPDSPPSRAAVSAARRAASRTSRSRIAARSGSGAVLADRPPLVVAHPGDHEQDHHREEREVAAPAT